MFYLEKFVSHHLGSRLLRLGPNQHRCPVWPVEICSPVFNIGPGGSSSFGEVGFDWYRPFKTIGLYGGQSEVHVALTPETSPGVHSSVFLGLDLIDESEFSKMSRTRTVIWGGSRSVRCRRRCHEPRVVHKLFISDHQQRRRDGLGGDPPRSPPNGSLFPHPSVMLRSLLSVWHGISYQSTDLFITVSFVYDLSWKEKVSLSL